MERYRIWYTMEGYVDVDVDSEEEARSWFHFMSQGELESNLMYGAEIDDIRPQ